MPTRENWSRHLHDILRSRHYTWIGEGLGGQPIDEALKVMLTDIIHLCRHEGISFEELAAECQARCDAEELKEEEHELADAVA